MSLTPNAGKTVVQEAHDAMGGLNVLINNAGIGSLGSVEDEDYGMFQNVMKVDVDSIFLGCKYAIPLDARSWPRLDRQYQLDCRDYRKRQLCFLQYGQGCGAPFVEVNRAALRQNRRADSV